MKPQGSQKLFVKLIIWWIIWFLHDQTYWYEMLFLFIVVRSWINFGQRIRTWERTCWRWQNNTRSFNTNWRIWWSLRRPRNYWRPWHSMYVHVITALMYTSQNKYSVPSYERHLFFLTTLLTYPRGCIRPSFCTILFTQL